jgi:hypothetical protein
MRSAVSWHESVGGVARDDRHIQRFVEAGLPQRSAAVAFRLSHLADGVRVARRYPAALMLALARRVDVRTVPRHHSTDAAAVIAATTRNRGVIEADATVDAGSAADPNH